jgi:beta-lactamase regulating signal transducer with metallopeptidase domain
MTDFLIKSSISLIAFLAFYRLILERENFHEFKRYYLLFSLVMSMMIPFITFEIIEEIIIEKPIEDLMGTTNIVTIPQEVENINYTLLLLSVCYAIITIIMIFRFATNIRKLLLQKEQNNTITYKYAKLVLLKEKVLPYTFLHYIFISEEEYLNQKIEEELYTHELTHVREKHSLDVIFIELLSTLFWFNPILILYKRAIQLNHEFLADQKVVIQHNNVSFYQSLLLEKNNVNQTIYLASNLNYLLTKKRLIMMTKKTSQKIAVFKKMAIIPVIAGLLMFLCFKTVPQEKVILKKEAKAVLSASERLKAEKLNEKNKIRITEQIRKTSKESAKTVEETAEEMRAEMTVSKESQDTVKKKKPAVEDEIINSAFLSEQPQFEGGFAGFFKFQAENYKMPEEAIKNKVNGRIFLHFVIEKDGSLSTITLRRDLGFGTGEEAIRVLSICPKWKPGMLNGEAVRTSYSLPMKIVAN